MLKKSNNNKKESISIDEQEANEMVDNIKNKDKNKANKKSKKNKKVKSKKGLANGTRSIKDFLAPEGVNLSDEGMLQIGNKHVRSFVMNGYPKQVNVMWLDELISYDGNMDTAIYIEPADDRTALDELTNKITQFEAQLAVEHQKGNIKDITRLRSNIDSLYSQREKLEQNYENLFYTSIHANLYADNKEDLEKRTQLLDNKLKGRKISLLPMYLQQDDAFKSALPFGQNLIVDKYRNLNSGALTACYPFYNSEISHKNGIFAGVNLATSTPLRVNFYDRDVLNNSNLTVIGQAGSGKTFFVSLLTLRSALRGIRTVIIDPEGEYRKLTQSLGGSYIKISPNSNTFINPFDLEEEHMTNDDGKATGEVKVIIKDKVADLLNLIGVMVGGLSKEELSLVSAVLTVLYQDRGFTTDPESLYITEPYLDEETGEFYHDGMKKPMPTFSDFHDKLIKYGTDMNKPNLINLSDALLMFKKGGVYDLFDNQTSPELLNFKEAPIVTFDVSDLEENILRPIGMYIAMSWTWEKFVKKNPEIQKRVVCDEAWMLVNPNMQGFEYTSDFLNKSARRIRKRNGGLLVASQSFMEFENNPQGKAVLLNAVVNIFLQQDTTDIDGVQSTFKLSNGERNFLLSAKQGEYLIKMNNESSVAYALAFEVEKAMIIPNYKSN